MWLLAECTVHVEMNRETEERGGGGVGRRKQERGSVRCSEVGTELKSEESAVSGPLGGLLDMFVVFF